MSCASSFSPAAFFTEASKGGVLHSGSPYVGRCFHPGLLVPGSEAAILGDYERAPDPASPHVAVQYVSCLPECMRMAPP